MPKCMTKNRMNDKKNESMRNKALKSFKNLVKRYKNEEYQETT